MGLDSSLFIFEKPQNAQSYYNEEETRQLQYKKIRSEYPIEDAVKATITDRIFDVEAFVKSKDANFTGAIVGYGPNTIYYKDGDEIKELSYDIKDLSGPFSYTKTEEVYLCTAKEVAYWRKNWDLVFIIEDYLDSNIENCKYYKLTLEDLKSLLNICEEYDFMDSYNKETAISELNKILKLKPHNVYFFNWW